MSAEELQAELRKSNALLRATEKDRDQWKAVADKREQELTRIRTDAAILQVRAESAENKVHALREGLQQLTESFG